MKAKRLLSILLCLVVFMSMLCVMASASDIDADLGVGENPFLETFEITKQPQNQNVAMGDTVLLNVQAQTSAVDAVITYQWYTNNGSKVAIVNNEIYAGANTATLSINTANTDWCKTDGVSIFCRVSNGMRDIESEGALIKVSHRYGDWETVTKPTPTTDGLAECRCTGCGTLLDSKVIEKTGKSALDVFTDIKKGDWFVDNGAIDFVYNANLFVGTSETTFGPHGKMNRAMFVTVLGRLHGVDGTKKTSKFSDVKKEDYFSGYVAWASENGIVSGITTETFGPYQSVTREQICAIMYRYCNFAKIELKDINAPITFVDAGNISPYATQAVAACQRGGLVSGKGDGKFDPKGTATRAEVATIMMKFSENYVK